MDSNDKKVALITGASSGIGETTALRLKNAGYIVYAAARRVERMAGLREQGINVISLDLTDESSMVAAVQGIMKEQGRIDILVNNAGYGSYGALEDVPQPEARRQFDVNVFGAMRLAQLCLPSMRERRFGKIVNITSIGGKLCQPMGGWYHATKFALEALSDCMRTEVRGFGIDVIVVEPGGIRSEWAGIAGDNLMKISGGTAYAELARQNATLLAATTKSLAPPDVIAKVIEKAIRAKTPRTRYVAGTGAVFLLLLRRLLPDRAFDWVMLAAMRWAR
jgi:NAD(P)-dependent dehydrogenase (short-subunit alcohol dehydrogenase family)